MHKALLSLAILTALAFAGCAGDKHSSVDPATCPDGTVLTSEGIEALPDHHGAGFNATDTCPVPPKVSLIGLPSTLGAYSTAAFTWSIDNGSVPKGHSMLATLRFAPASVPSNLVALDKYPGELVKREHQNLPVAYKGNVTFNDPGTVFVRAFAAVQGAGYERREFWSDEVRMEITPVAPTGKVVDFTIEAGAPLAGQVSPDQAILVLGDAIRVVNEDPVARSCTWTSGPVATESLGDGEGDAESVVMVVPGAYEYECNTVQPTTFKVIVNA